MEVWVALAAFTAIVLLILWGRRPTRLLSGKRGRLPKHLELAYIPTGDIPADAQRPLGYLAGRLSDLGFEVADLPARIPALQRFGHRLLIVPFVHPGERAYFLMGIEAGLLPKTQLVLHIISLFTDERRVETTTLQALDLLSAPDNVQAQVVLDADTIDEIWSRHRRVLTEYERDLRAEALPDDWRTAAVLAYDGWIQSAVRAQRLQLEPDGIMYRVRNPSGSGW